MKRAFFSSSLVEYSSSEDDDNVEKPVKRKKLPTLSASLVVAAPIDDPSLHQGRKRNTPHVDGQWAAHVYISLGLNRKSALFSLLSQAIQSAKDEIPSLNDFWSKDGDVGPELHVSLSRPIYLRAYQREDLKRAVKSLALTHQRFTISFSTFAELTNDEGTRTFLTIEVGAGHHQLSQLSTALAPTLQGLRQKGYYAEPRFHASVAWALLDEAPSESQTQFPTIPGIPSRLIDKLNQEYQSGLSAKSMNFYDADTICVKIGKEVFSWRLKGSGQ
ncbi:U6 snRNA phosphodiesterase Usb1 [Desarmillaria tabescens]|uniref:U6 snRNA phosphodiesterase 1 n=1 Tax=Armillaria tabescens TaxID=1929756 RepID=A0AA39NR17_ARMTA|nr:U6 snRNA phosphodiesterase Usb1 [Desarmillaria tabescens]KAK0470251.1 U6 snRNA phosphodiesterase Usb1 [Desarmillaria tabescens]